MSKSTPLSSLPNVKSQPYEERENQLVKEILSEIDGNDQQNEVKEDLEQSNVEIQQQQQLQQENNQHMMEQQMMEQQMMEQNAVNESKELNENIETVESESLTDNLVNLFKQPLIVGLIAVIISVPQFTSVLEKMISSNTMLLTYSSIIILLLKGLLAGGLYFTINKSL